MKRTLLIFGATLAFAAPTVGAPAPDISSPLKTIRAVGPEGQGNQAASRAWAKLAAADAAALPEMLEGMKGANDLAANWLRAAVEAIADRESGSGDKLPVTELGAFVIDTQNDPRARHLAFELIERVDPGTASQMLGGMLNDPSGALRRLAVAQVIGRAEAASKSGNKTGATLLYQQALTFARAPDQIKAITKPMRQLGQSLDLQKLFGFVTEWQVIGPFDSTDRKGFNAVYPPEKSINLDAEYPGKEGKVRWSKLVSDDEFGMVDINQPYGQLKEVAAYAYTEFHSDATRAAELRLGCKNAWKIWFNGKLVFGRDEYHRGMEIDQYRLPVTLKPGANKILVKVCQNEQQERWTVEWQFQLRVCDPLGTPIHSRHLKTAKR